VACNDDSCDLGSRVIFTATAGVEHTIVVGGFIGGRGNFQLTIDNVFKREENQVEQNMKEGGAECPIPCMGNATAATSG